MVAAYQASDNPATRYVLVRSTLPSRPSTLALGVDRETQTIGNGNVLKRKVTLCRDEARGQWERGNRGESTD